MSGLHETGITTGTKDKYYDLFSYTTSCLKNALRMEVYRKDAERDDDTELVELFAKAQADSRKGAEIGKKLLTARLAAASKEPPADETPNNELQPPLDVMAPHEQKPGGPGSS